MTVIWPRPSTRILVREYPLSISHSIPPTFDEGLQEDSKGARIFFSDYHRPTCVRIGAEPRSVETRLKHHCLTLASTRR